MPTQRVLAEKVPALQTTHPAHRLRTLPPKLMEAASRAKPNALSLNVLPAVFLTSQVLDLADRKGKDV